MLRDNIGVLIENFVKYARMSQCKSKHECIFVFNLNTSCDSKDTFLQTVAY